NGKLPKELWITSSDDFSSWGGGDPEYHVEDLNELIKAVDFISMHTYPMHNTHYNPEFWGVLEREDSLSKEEKILLAMARARDFATAQYSKVKEYMLSLEVEKPIHIGETGWASFSNGHYGQNGSRATDEFKEGIYYQLMREWTNKENISCFYFEAFDEPWKDSHNPKGSENHFGLFTKEGKAKYAIWDLVDQGVFEGLYRSGNAIAKSQNGDQEKIIEESMMPPLKEELELVQ
ncbi:MAG: glycosyl hydrolase family 17 protein, partial [Bacteroidota bacterium]